MKFINSYKRFLFEGLSKDQEDYFMEDWDQDRLEDWFGKNNHRLYFPLKKRVSDGDVEEFVDNDEESIENQINTYLKKNYGFQYEIEDYFKGYAIDHKNKGRIIKLGKILKDRHLLQAFNDDPIRAGNRMMAKQPIICLSKHPIDIAAMSTGRGWTSCKELPSEARPNGGAKHKFLKEEVKVLLIAYLIYPDDKKIERPICRVCILPYYNEKGQCYYNVHQTVYGSAGALETIFIDTLEDWFDEKQKDLRSVKSSFVLDAKVYDDGAPGTIHVGDHDLSDTLLDFIDGSYTINADGKIDVQGNVKITSKVRSILEIGRFGYVSGNFVCYECRLTSLEGSPEEVGGNFVCSYNKLTSLVGSPKKVGGKFMCTDNRLTSLEGCPKEIGDEFNCVDNRLVSLIGGPDEINGDFICSINRIKHLQGAPRIVGGNFACEKNQITSLEGGPEEVGKLYLCSENPLLTSLKGAPRVAGKGFVCGMTAITSLEGGPEEAYDYFCGNNKNLVSLKGAPKIVHHAFSCINTGITKEEILKVEEEYGYRIKY